MKQGSRTQQKNGHVGLAELFATAQELAALEAKLDRMKYPDDDFINGFLTDAAEDVGQGHCNLMSAISNLMTRAAEKAVAA